MFGIIRKKVLTLDVVVLFIILSIAHFKDFFLSCVSYLNLNFDSQIPLTWDFSALNNLFPYKDIYFPYGILLYFKNTNVLLSIIYFFLPIILFVSIYIALGKILKNKFLALVSLISFYLFIYKFTDTESFSRYGIILFIVLLLSYVFYKFDLISIKTAFLLGILIGAIFSIIPDQGIYAFLLFVFLLVLTPILKKLKQLSYFNFLFVRIIAGISGIAIGILPFILFLKANNVVNEFMLFIKHMSDFVLYAKTPFIPFSTSTDNLFTFGSIFIATVALSFKIFILKKRLSFTSFLELSLVFILIILEQKNIIRSIDKQITFISFFLFLILVCELIQNKVSKFFPFIVFVIISAIVLSGFVIHPFINYKLEFKKELANSFLNQNVNDFLYYKSSLCLKNNLDRLITNRYTKLEKVKKMIEEDSKDYIKIFNYLSDPVFYVLFNQKPPYYFTIFEATPLYAQKSNIKYIEENKVKYVIYNTDILRIQDGVPTYVRSKLLFRYVMDNFRVLGKVENFIIYKKIGRKDV